MPKIYYLHFYNGQSLMIMNNATRKITIKQIYALFLNHDVKMYFHNRLCFLKFILFLKSGSFFWGIDNKTNSNINQ